jgi:hypothetical protein
MTVLCAWKRLIRKISTLFHSHAVMRFMKIVSENGLMLKLLTRALFVIDIASGYTGASISKKTTA